MGSSELRAFIQPLQRWWWLLAIAATVAMLASFFYVASQSPVYKSEVALIVGTNMQNPNLNSGEFYLAQQLAGSYAEMANLSLVHEAIKVKLGLDLLPNYLVYQLPNSQVIRADVYGTDPERAFAIATELTKQIMMLGPAGEEDQIEQAFVAEQLAKLRISIKNTENEVAREENTLLNINSARELARTQAEIQALQGKLTTLRTNYTTLRATTQRGAVNAIQILQSPTLPTKPTDPALLLTVLVAGVLGCVLAASGAYLIEYTDDRVKSTDEIRKELKLALLGTVPKINQATHNASAKVVMLDIVASPAVEAYRTLRTNLQFANGNEPLRQILITSSQAEEGKSVTAANISVALARAGKRVILVDADLHRPAQHHLFKLINNVGLTNVLLAQHADLNGLLQPTLVPGLSVLTSGPLPPNPAELLGSQRMQELLVSLEQQADVVIIDSPPITTVVDAVILSTTADGVLLVIRSGETRRETVKGVLDALQQVKSHVLGAVFNGVAEQRKPYYRGEDYGHYKMATWGDVTPKGANNGSSTATASTATSKANPILTARKRPQPEQGVNLQSPAPQKPQTLAAGEPTVVSTNGDSGDHRKIQTGLR